MPTADCPTVELQRREVFGKAFTVDIVVVVSRTQCRSISRYFKSHGRIRLNLSQSDSLPDSLASHLQVTCLSCLRQSYHSRRRGVEARLAEVLREVVLVVPVVRRAPAEARPAEEAQGQSSSHEPKQQGP